MRLLMTQIWVVTRLQYGISALVSQTLYRAETVGNVTKCRLFSQARAVQQFPLFVTVDNRGYR